MFNKNKPKTYDQDVIDRLQNRIFYLEKVIKEREEFLNNVQRNASVVIDWDKLNCVSVERVCYDGECPKTILCHISESRIEDFFLFVSDAKHEEIAEEFKQYLASKK